MGNIAVSWSWLGGGKHLHSFLDLHLHLECLDLHLECRANFHRRFLLDLKLAELFLAGILSSEFSEHVAHCRKPHRPYTGPPTTC